MTNLACKRLVSFGFKQKVEFPFSKLKILEKRYELQDLGEKPFLHHPKPGNIFSFLVYS